MEKYSREGSLDYDYFSAFYISCVVGFELLERWNVCLDTSYVNGTSL